VTSYQRERVALGERLRELRRDARLTGRELAAACGWQPSKVSKIEAGKQTPSDRDVEAWAGACEVPAQVGDLVTALRSLESHYQEYRRILRAGLAGPQREFGEMESRAIIIRDFEAVFVSGLLQTQEYARSRLAVPLDYAEASPNDLDDAVAARMERQQVLYQPGKKIHIVLTEAALRYRLCDIDAMTAQLDRLVAATTIKHIRFGIIPFETVYAAPPTNGFWIFDKDLVRVEAVTAELHIGDTYESGRI
jgi:transcriptional regulator with XRE-family HTH domain